MRRFKIATSVCLGLLLVQSAAARPWMNRAGKVVEAEFVSANETEVTLKLPNGNEATVKLETLSDADQQFVREKTSPPKTASAPTKTFKIGDRKWTDVSGHTVTGKFVRMDGSAVVVLVSGRQIPIPFNNLSEADRAYVRAALESRGEKLELPATGFGAGQVPNNPAPPVVPPPIVPAAGQPGPESLKAFEGLTLVDGTVVTAELLAALPENKRQYLARFANFNEAGRLAAVRSVMGSPTQLAAQKQREEEFQQRAAVQRAEQEKRSAEAQARIEADRKRFEQESQARAAQAAAGKSSPASTTQTNPKSSPTTRQPKAVASLPTSPSKSAPKKSLELNSKYCMRCKKPVAENVTVGDRCPHCGILFVEDESTGEKLPNINASPQSSQQVISILGAAVLGIGGLVAISCVGIGVAYAMGLFGGSKASSARPIEAIVLPGQSAPAANPFAVVQTVAPLASQKNGSREDLRSIAIFQKLVIGCVLIHLVALVGQFLLPVELRLFVAVGMAFVMIASAVFVVMLGVKVYGTARGIVMGFMTLLPLLGLIVLLVINGKATDLLKKNGIKVGFFGANLRKI